MHLRADFPNNSPWPDWAKYTDEGWYGSAAIRHYQLGQWNLPGDFNPAAALPVWPLLELLLFHFTGVSLLAARALSVTIFGLILTTTYLLLKQWAHDRAERSTLNDPAAARSLAPVVAVLLLAANPFFFVFSRLAILEPLMILLALASLVLAQRAGIAWSDSALNRLTPANQRRNLLKAIAWATALGLSTVTMVLTKTTAVFLIPALMWMLWTACSYHLRTFLGAGGVATAVAGVTWIAYVVCFIRPHYLSDYRYLFSANGFTGITKATFWTVVQQTLFSVGFIGAAIFWMGLVATITITAVLLKRRQRNNALGVTLLIWILFYLGFLAYHDNLSPRYYQAIGIPLIMLIAMAFDQLCQNALSRSTTPETSSNRALGSSNRIFVQSLAAVASFAIGLTTINGGAQEIWYTRHAEYSFVSAANQIRLAVDRQRAQELATGRPVHPQLLLSISNANISLVAGLPSICDDFGTMTLQERIATYKPGWYVAWNDVEDDKMEALAPMYRLVRVGAWPAFDDPDRNLLILYRLDPLDQPRLGSSRRRTALNIPRQLRRVASASSQVSH